MATGSLNDKTAIITGAGAGMGAATAELFAAEGANVLVVDRDEDSGNATAQRITDDQGNAEFYRTDISSASDVEAMVAHAVRLFGRLDCAVNNAAVGPNPGRVADFDEQAFERTMAVNLTGTALCLKHELRQLIEQGNGGSIVNIGSVNSHRPQVGSLAYTASKHGVVGLTKTAAVEYASHGIRVNTVCPGGIDTPMIRAALDATHDDEADMASALSLFERFGQPVEVAQASLWLCGPASSFVTGHSLAVDAGYLAR